MKTSDLMLIGLLGLGAYFVLGKKQETLPDAVTGTTSGYIPAGYITPAGNTVTRQINSVQEGVAYINKEILQKTNNTSKTSSSDLIQYVVPRGNLTAAQSLREANLQSKFKNILSTTSKGVSGSGFISKSPLNKLH